MFYKNLYERGKKYICERMCFSVLQKSVPNFVPALLVRKYLFFLVLFAFYTLEICFIIKLYKTNRASVQKSYTNFVIL